MSKQKPWKGGRLTHDEQLQVVGDILRAGRKLDTDSRAYAAKRLAGMEDSKPEPEELPTSETMLPFLPARDRTGTES